MGRRARTWLRRASAAALLAALVAIVIVAVQRAGRLDTPLLGVDPAEGHGERDEETVARYIEFQYRESDAGEIVFELSSARTLGFSSGWHEIQGVRLQLYEDGEPTAVLTCDMASFNRQSRDARLAGGVHLEFPDGGFLNTERAHFDAARRRLSSDGLVLFSSEGVVGEAGRAVYELEEDRLVLDSGVRFQDELGSWLEGNRLVYQRDEARVALPDGCAVGYGGLRLRAPRGMVELEGREGEPLRLALTDGARLTGVLPGDGDHVTGFFERLVAERDARGRWQVQGATSSEWIRLAFLGTREPYVRSLKTQSLRGVVGAEGILNVQTSLGTCLLEVPPEGPPHRADSDEAKLWFSDGEATDAELEGNVRLSGGGLEGRGHRARLAARGGIAMLHGDGSGTSRAVLVSDRGEVRCDQAQLFQSSGALHARGDVQGFLVGVALLGGGGGENGDPEESPLHFAGQVLDADEDAGLYRLREAARSWQGEHLLLADEIVYKLHEETMLASGHVRTTLPASRLLVDSAPDQEVVVTARALDYRRPAGTAVYSGKVTYADPQHTLQASELTIRFGAGDRISSLEAEGAVELSDLTTGRRMTGQTAVYDLSSRQVHLTGEPVKLIDASGTSVQASSLTWDRASGTVTVAGDTETIYYPEATP